MIFLHFLLRLLLMIESYMFARFFTSLLLATEKVFFVLACLVINRRKTFVIYTWKLLNYSSSYVELSEPFFSK